MLKPGYPLRVHIPMFTGRAHVLDHRVFSSSDIHLEEIALGLSGINRYNGQSRISVLRHSIGLANKYPYPSQRRLYALLHDASEAFLMDVPVASKQFMNEEWLASCKQLDSMILRKFNCAPSGEEIAEVKTMDKALIPFEMGVVWKALHPQSKRIGPCGMSNLGGGEVVESNYMLYCDESNLCDMFISEVEVMSGLLKRADSRW